MPHRALLPVALVVLAPVLLAVAIASFAVVAWYLKKRRATTAEPYAVPTTGPTTATSVSEAS